MRMGRLFESQTTILANLRLGGKRIELNVLNRMTESTTSTVAYRHISGNFNYWKFINELFGIAAMNSIIIL